MNVIDSRDIVNISWEARKGGFVAGFAVGVVTALVAYRKMKKMDARLRQSADQQQ